MVISKANSILFFEENATDLQTFENRLPCIETHYKTISLPSRQYFKTGNDLVIQVSCDEGNELVMVGQTGDLLVITRNLERTAGGRDYYSFTIESSIETTTYLTVTETETGEVYKSNTLKFLLKDDYQLSREGYLKLQWFNSDNAFMMDYTVQDSNEWWIKGALLEYSPKSESNIFSNDEETIKLKDVIKRTLKLQTGVMSRQLAEKIRVAMAHDRFYVNGVEFVLEEDAEMTPIGHLVEVSAVLTQRNVLGLNTNDLGFSGTSTNEVMVVEYFNQTSTFVTSALPENTRLTTYRYGITTIPAVIQKSK